MSDNRRDFLKKGALLSLSGLAGSLMSKEKIQGLENFSSLMADSTAHFTQLPLPYAYNALEPFIDAKTMEIHYTKHHKGYVDKLNDANPAGINYSVSDADKCKSIDSSTSPLVRNNLGGHYNHTLFWQMMKPNSMDEPNLPQGKLAEAINKQFKSFEDFKKEFSDKAVKIFGSGWCWLIVSDKGVLEITTTPNQDNPLMKVAAERGKPVLALDVWEHAYYLNHQNKRADYIADWWHIVNWQKAEELFA
jgi:Fe-Mn family superoxide dismutase